MQGMRCKPKGFEETVLRQMFVRTDTTALLGVSDWHQTGGNLATVASSLDGG
jgi:hypothetical protein